MGKREADMFAAQLEGVDLDAPRAKRHKTAASSSVVVKKEADATSGASSALAEAKVATEDPQVVKSKGLKLWQSIKDAVNKDNRLLATDFLRLPSKRQYPDYYEIIKRPVSLDDIKQRLESGKYATFEEVKLDVELVFKNAKKYNVKDSGIWRDAKVLHKLALKEFDSLAGANAAPDGDEEEAVAADGGSDGEGNADKKKKPPNLTRLLKTRLQKLVDKTDDEGRVLSAEFMELPSKKQWPDYYRQIKHPQCFENIFKHLKRKEYSTSLDFANDVELVFSNAVQFNMEHTPIWEDTIVLRDYFRQLMSDLPHPYSIPAYASPDHSTKIKLKMPSHAAAASSSTVAVSPQNPSAAVASPRLRIPPLASTSSSSNVAAPLPAQAIAASTPHTVAGSRTTPIAALPATVQTGTTAQSSAAYPAFPVPVSNPSGLTPQLSSYNQQPFAFVQPKQHYPTASYQATAITSTTTPTLPNTNNIHVNLPRAAKAQHAPPVHAQALPSVPRTPQPPPVKIPNQIPPSLLAAKSPTPISLENRRQLRFVAVTTLPFGRQIDLDHRDGVKTWSVRLGPGEVSVRVGRIKFLSQHHGDDGESSDEEEHKSKEKDRDVQMDKDKETKPDDAEKSASGVADTEHQSQQHEEEEEEAEEPPPQEKPAKRGRGRPRKKPRLSKPTAETAPKDNGKTKVPQGPVVEEEVQLKCNGTIIAPLEEAKETWEVPLGMGLNVLEIGEKSGNVWRMYLERMVAV